MAIGDTLNQNPFGTNYNPEDEEEKKARLAAQNAMMGAGGVTPPIVDEGGNIISRGFDFLFGAPTQEQAQKTLETQPTDPAQRENLQAILRGEERPSSASKAANFLLGPLDNDPNILGPQQETAQAPSVDSALEATPSIAPPVESLSGDAQGQGMDMNQSAIMNALTDQNQGMDMNQQAIANAQGQEATVSPPAQTLSQFMRYEDAPEQRTSIGPESRLRHWCSS